MDLIYNRDVLIELLQKIDKELASPAKLYVIGGSAACLAYDSKIGTKDIDTWNRDQTIEDAYHEVIKKFPRLKIPIGPAYVNIRSPEMLKRFKLYNIVGLVKLKVFVPTVEDLFLLKAQRAVEKDIVDLKELAKKQTLSEKILIRRFLNELLPQYFANDQILKDNYLVCVEEVFGEDIAEKHSLNIQKTKSPRRAT